MPWGLARVKTYFAMGDFARAKGCVAQARRTRRLRPEELLTLGRIALLENRLDEAELSLSAALEGGEVRAAVPLLAETFYRSDEFDSAATWWRRAGRRAMATKLASFAGTTPYQHDLRAARRLKFVQVDPLPVVRVRVNDLATGNFLLDTGGSEVYLDSEFADQVGASRFGRERGTFAGGRRASYEHGKVDSLLLSDLLVRNVPVHILPLGHLRGIAGRRRIHGILGTVLLHHFTPTIDYLGAELVLRPLGSRPARDRGPRSSAGARAPFWMDGDHFVVAKGSINRRPTLLFLDSGLAGGGFACPPSMMAEAGIPPPEGPVLRGEGGGGSVEARRFVVDRIQLGRAEQRDIVGWSGVFPRFLEHNFGYRIGGLLSHGFLRNYRVTFDFARMQLTLAR